MDEKIKKIGGFIFVGIAAALIITGIVFIATGIANSPSILDSFEDFAAKMELQAQLIPAGMGFLAGGAFLMMFSLALLLIRRVRFSNNSYSVQSPIQTIQSPIFVSGFQPSPQSKVVKEVIREIVKVKCPFCGVLVEITLSICPNCGGTVH